jgi:hypothetical protein
MKQLKRLLLLSILASGLAVTASLRAEKSAPAAESASAPADYPLTTCIVSGDDLDEMGHPYNYVYREDGKADRTVRFCCKDCVKDFKKDPQKYLSALDRAEAKAKSGKADAPAASVQKKS